MIVVATEAEYNKFKSEEHKTIMTGVGYGNVYKTLANIPRDTPIINVGYAGSNSLPIGQVCTIGKCMHYHPNVSYNEVEYTLPGKYTCFTSDDFVLSTDIQTPVVFDMELYAILSMGFTNVIAIKIVSDNLSIEEYESKVEKDANVYKGEEFYD